MLLGITNKKLPNPTGEYFITVSLLFISAGCVLFSAIVYSKYPESSLMLITTEPFVDFGPLKDIYNNPLNKKLGTAIAMNKTLLNKAFCLRPTSDVSTYPETRSPACTCIAEVYADFMYDIAVNVMLNTTVVATQIKTYVARPWVVNATAKSWLLYYAGSVIVIPDAIIHKYDDQTVGCLKHRSTWLNAPYKVKIHPVAMSFYCSSALFMLAWSLVFRVMANAHTGDWSKWFLFFFAVGASSFLFIIDLSSNYIYAIALLCICINFVTSLNYEFTSMMEDIQHKPTGRVFYPPHPIMSGLWYYIQIAFPIMIVYLGLTNLQRDIVALLGYYVVGFIIATCVQRLFWVKWYVTQNIRVVGEHLHTLESSHMFRRVLVFCLGFIIICTSFMCTMLVFMQWYNQDFMSGNWFAMLMGLAYTLVLFIEFFDGPSYTAHGDNGLKLGIVQIIQIYVVAAINVTLVISTTIDAVLK